MLKKRLLRTCKNVMAAAICISLAVGLSACGETQGERRHLNDKNDTTENTERAQESFSEDALKEQQEFEQYLDDYFKDVVTDDTLTYNYTIRDGADYGLEEPEVTLGDPGMTAEEIGQDKEEFEGWVKKLDAIDRSCLTEDQKLTYDVLDEYFEVSAGIFDNVYLYEPFSPMRGLQANIATNFTDYRFDDKGDVERYIELLGQIPDYFAEYLKRTLLTAAVSAAAVLWVQRFPVGNFGIFILDGLLYTAVFAGVIVLFYRGSEEYDTLKQRGLKILKRRAE